MSLSAARSDLLRVYFAAFCTLAAMYAPQPLFNAMSLEFGVGPASISLLVTVVLLPLAIAPLAYGFLLEAVPPGRVLFWSMTGLALLQAGMGLAPAYWLMLLLRCGQGLLVPAMLTGLMTHIGATQGKGTVQRSMALYIASTIFGAFMGRLTSGYMATHLGWRAAFLGLAGALGLCALLLTRLSKKDTRASAGFKRPSLADLPQALRQPGFLRMYSVVFCAFFVFASLLNFLPFRLTEVAGDVSELRIALMYSGYLLGIVICLNVMPLVHHFGGERRAVLLGLAYFLVVVACFASPHPLFTQASMLLFPPGFFLVHAVMPGYMNRLARSRAGLVNGLYLAIYYLGGALGSWLPGFVYRAWGWGAYVLLCCLVLGLGLALALGMPRGESDNRPADPTGCSR